MYFLFLVVLGGAPSLGPSKTGFLLVDAGYRHRESPGEIFDLKWFFHFTAILREFRREVSQASILIEPQIFTYGEGSSIPKEFVELLTPVLCY
jgi:hypothetical protein